ncbi:penicillin-binding protein 1B [Psychromonas marina]|uniref:Penicillin-binding protein 1B n=1 Tax=Psychromonas marina TaxID=88364 RepID=A0ABQ6E2J4_9GAMM|nr:penicillin-binding protein 1B [Psychromonas marina]GLS91410.1 penicillin-binding protein 1B [Psychromonas marina]
MSNINKNRSALFNKKFFLITLFSLLVTFIVFLVYLDSQIRTTFDGKKWSIPSTVYARALEIYPGAQLSVKDLQSELTLLGYQFVEKVSKPGQAAIQGSKVTLYTSGFQFPDGHEPARNITLHFKNDHIETVNNDDGVSLLRLAPVVIGGIYPAHNEDRLLVQLDEVPASLVAMLVAVEDSEFYDHYGVSPRGIARALVANIKGGSISQGASTLTQQLVKNYFLSSEKTLSRKVQEALMSLLLELHFSKNEILEGYINEIYLGQDGPRAIHGFGLASQYYFRQPLQDLSLEQQALLVTLVRGASYYNPWRHPQRAQDRRDLVLDITVREGMLDADLAASAKKVQLNLGDKSSVARKRYPAYLDLVRRQLKRDYDTEDLSSNGLSVFTHFDPLVQSSAENSLSNMVSKQKKSVNGKNLEGAVVVTRPNTGAVIAVVGGNDARYAGFNRAIDAQRQVGSLIKPAIYLTALQDSEHYNLASRLNDDQYSLPLDNGDVWTPQNYDKQFHGDVLLYKALANSYNVSTARLGNTLGLPEIINTMHKLGVEQDISALPSLTLGAVALSPFEMAQMYQTIAAEGFYTPLLAIDSVSDAQGNMLTRYPLQVEQRFDSATMYMLRHAMQAVTHEGTGKALEWLLPDFSVAGKTGTTNNLRDSWFAGFSGDMMSVVWLGKDDNSNTGLTGSSGALRVWSNIIKQRSHLTIQNIPPETIDIGWVDKDTGVGSQKSCPNAIPLPFLKDTAPEIEIHCNQGVEKVLGWFKNILN